MKKSAIQVLIEKRKIVAQEINILLDNSYLCSEEYCEICGCLIKLGFLYELITSKIRELKGLSTEIDGIIDRYMGMNKLSFHWLSISCEYIFSEVGQNA